jgi:hypothetical protein
MPDAQVQAGRAWADVFIKHNPSEVDNNDDQSKLEDVVLATGWTIGDFERRLYTIGP